MPARSSSPAGASGAPVCKALHPASRALTHAPARSSADRVPSLATLPRDLSLFAKYHLKRRVVDHPARETELGVVPLGFEPKAYTERIRAYAPRIAVSTLAERDNEGESFPMLEGRVEPEGADKTLLVLAGVHGNEHAGLLAVPPILDRFATEAPRVRVAILTPANPVGAAHLSRYNANGYDINRDFVRFDTAEARAIRDAFDRLAPDFVVSLHEGPQDATFFFANPRVERALATDLLARLEAAGVILASSDYFGRTLRPAGYAPTGPIMSGLHWLWARTLGMMATGTFADERGIPEITLESSWRLADPDQRVRAHVELVLALATTTSW